MSFSFDEKDTESTGGKVPPGAYQFQIVDVVEKVSQKGNPMWKLTLETQVSADRLIKVFDNIVNTPEAIWKLRCVCDAIDVTCKSPMDPGDILGRTGKAEYVEGEKGYLEIAKYIPANASNTGKAKPKDNDEIPF